MQLTVDINTKKMTDATGMVALAAVDKPQLFYGTRETLEFTFLNDGEPVEFTETDTFSVALDSNFIHTDSLMASASDAVVIDGSSGRVNLTLDMRSESFNEKLNGKESVGAYLEVTVQHHCTRAGSDRGGSSGKRRSGILYIRTDSIASECGV